VYFSATWATNVIILSFKLGCKYHEDGGDIFLWNVGNHL
jgi:hypothetical protein